MTAQTATRRHQFYLTHCARSDSVVNTVGFSVRAASSAEPELLRAAMGYPAYELPMEMWSKLPGREDAPRRLARIRGHDGVMVVHTVYLEKDTMNRDRSYFTHALLLPDADPADVLRAWNSGGWETDYPSGKEKELSAPPGLPSGRDVSDSVLTKFLTATGAGPGGSLARAVWPKRLPVDPAERQELVGRFLHGVLLAATAADGEPRNQLYVHAEPGLVALLAYAAARLLPRSAFELTFSTFEPAHRGLREFKLALVVGTYLGNPAKGLDSELVRTRGFALDTFDPKRNSEELAVPVPPGMRELVALAATGQWNAVASVQDLYGDTPLALARLADVIRLAGALTRLEAGQATLDDLIVLRKDPGGAAKLALHEAELWPRIRDQAPAHPALRQAFREWFAKPHHADEVLEAAFALLAAGKSDQWERRWTTFAEVVPPAVASDAFGRMVTRNADVIAQLTPQQRGVLRAALTGREVDPDAALPVLRAGTPAELDVMLADRNLPEWAVAAAAFHVRFHVKSDEMRQRVVEYLRVAATGVLGSYAAKAHLHFTAHPKLADEIIAPTTEATAAAFDRLLGSGAEYVPAERWVWLVQRYKLLDGAARVGWLTTNQRLARLLRACAPSPAGEPVVSWTTAWIDDRLLRDDPAARAIWGELEKTETLLRGDGLNPLKVLPTTLVRKRSAARIVLDLRTDPAHASKYQPSEIIGAFEQFGWKDTDGLRALFRLRCVHATPESDPAAYAAFSVLFAAVLPASDSTYNPNERALSTWIWLSGDCPIHNRLAVQTFFYRHPGLCPTLPKFREMLLSRSPPELRDEVESTQIQEKRQSRADLAERRQTRKSIVLGLGLCAVLLAVIIAIVIFAGMKPTTVPPSLK